MGLGRNNLRVRVGRASITEANPIYVGYNNLSKQQYCSQLWIINQLKAQYNERKLRTNKKIS